MKFKCLIALAIVSAATVACGQTLLGLRLTGIVNLTDTKCAIMEEWRPDLRLWHFYNLKENQREDMLEVLRISPENRSIEINLAGVKTNLTLAQPDGATSAPKAGLDFSNAALDTVINLYSSFSVRTALRHPELNKNKLTLQISGTNRLDMVKALEKTFGERGISCIPDGEKFILIVPTSLLSKINAHSPKPTPAGGGRGVKSTTTPGKGELIIQAGEIDLPGTPLVQVLDLYGTLISTNGFSMNRAYVEEVRPSDLGKVITLTTITPVSVEEARYAIETVIAWHGYKVVPGTKDTLKAVPIPAK